MVDLGLLQTLIGELLNEQLGRPVVPEDAVQPEPNGDAGSPNSAEH